MMKEYKKCDVVILPSLSEATGTVLIEGMANGKPAITANYFGAKILLSNDCGWLYSGEDTISLTENFQYCLREAINNTQLVEKKSYEALKAVLNYTWEEKVNHFNEVYLMCLSRGEKA
jgi:glycosyltransferase involved in cell wall biosynthesis